MASSVSGPSRNALRAALLAAALAVSAAAQAPPDPARKVRELIPDESVQHGLQYLASCQDPLSGAFGSLHGQMGVTALATLAFLAHGEHDSRGGRFERQVQRGIGYILDHQKKDGYLVAEGDDRSRMHGHGYATCALAQAYGMFGNRRRAFRAHRQLRDALKRAVALIVRTQGAEGGWMYTPKARDGHEGSITVTMVQTLRAARDCGLLVPRSTVDRALKYLARSQEPDGSFRYSLNVKRTSFELTAAATTCFLALGEYRGSAVTKGRHYLETHLDRFLKEPAYPLYGTLYAAQVFWMDYEGETFARHMPRLIRFLLEIQDPKSGAFDVQRAAFRVRRSVRRQTDTVYTSAVALLTLAIPAQLLPLFQR